MRRPRLSWRSVLVGAAVAVVGWLVYTWATLPDARPLATKNPATTALIEHRAAEARASGLKPRHRQSWVSLQEISPHLVEAVLASEDSRFYQHHGVDLDELFNASKDAVKHRALGRGASTITQQLAKNLWLTGDRSLLRKLKELLLAERLEAALPKQRILALYLNVAEWGDGVYGAEAAAQEWYGVPASQLSVGQSAVLAAMLPAPRKRTPQSHSPMLQKRALWIVDRLVDAKKLGVPEALVAKIDVERILSGVHEEPEVELDADDAD